MSAQIAIRDLTLGYDGHPAVHHLSGAFDAGSLTAVVGPNGSGKSTLLKGIMGIVKPMTGAISRASTDIAYLPQGAEIDRSFPASVSDLVALGLWRKLGPFSGIGRADQRAIDLALGQVGLEGFGRRPIDTLSGGQFQRTLFARVLLMDAPVILLDEPFAAVDERSADHLVALVRRWHDEGRTVIAVLHDLDHVRAAFPRALLLAREPVAWGTTEEVLRPENLLKARRMTEAWDEHAPWHDDDEPHEATAAHPKQQHGEAA